MTRSFRLAVILLSLVFLECGCGSSVTESELTKNNTVQAAADRRIKFKDEYKEMLGKDGTHYTPQGDETLADAVVWSTVSVGVNRTESVWP